MYCYRHPKAETAVSCGKCDRPICPKCMVSGPAGMRCPDCASLRKTALYRVPPTRLALAILAGLATGTIGGLLMASLGSFIGFFVFLIGPFYGGLVAQSVLWASGRKRGRILEIIGVGSIVLGALLVYAPALLMAMHPPAAAPAHGGDAGPLRFAWGLGLIGLVWPLVGFGLAVSTCYWRLKYL